MTAYLLKRLCCLLLVGSFLISCKNEPSQDIVENNTMQNNTPKTAKNNYKLSWTESFNGSHLDEKVWNRQVVKAGRFNQEWQRYTDDIKNAHVENGQLIITALHDGKEHGMDKYTSARLNTAGKKTFKYGKIAASIKLPKGKGLWPAFWMLGANIDENGGDTPWPQCGEIDILELYGNKDNGAVEANMHYANLDNKHASMGAETFTLDKGIFADDFHLFELEWTPEKLVWSVDGETYAQTSIEGAEFAEFHQEHFILLNVAVGSEWAGRPDDSTVFPQRMYVDWIKYYEMD